MARIVDIDLYQSAEGFYTPLRATSLRKLYTSLLVVLLFIAAGTGLYFYLSSQDTAGAVVETPIKLIKPPLGVVVRQNNRRWAKFVSNALPLSPKSILSDVEGGFICLFSDNSKDNVVTGKDSLQKLCRALVVIDTSTEDGAYNLIVKGTLAPAHSKNSAQPVKKFMRTTVMNTIDSIAVGTGLVNLQRRIIGIDKLEDGETYKFLLSANGTLPQISRFFNATTTIQYSIAPVSLRINHADTTYSLDVIWGLFDFSTSPDSTAVVQQ